MDRPAEEKLLEINRRFYTEFGDAFAATRRRIQPGISRVLQTIPTDRCVDWLDLGCGSGALGKIWAAQGRSGSYTGMDFSGPLLREAQKETSDLSNDCLTLRYAAGDLMDPAWPDLFGETRFDGISAFASLHHIPGKDNHRRIFDAVRKLLRPGGTFVISVWQFQNSPKLMARVQPWELTGLSPEQAEPGDTLLDWRYALPGSSEKTGLRYVHLFQEEELRDLAAGSGFCPQEQFYSDGAEGNLALYLRMTV